MPSTKKRRTSCPTPFPPGTSVLALDTSSSCVGWSFFRDGLPVVHGKFVPVSADHGSKLVEFQDWLLEMLAEHSPDHLAVETPYPGRRRFAFGVLMMYYGVVLSTHVRWFGVEMPPESRVAAADVKRLNQMPKGTSYEARKRAMVLEMNRLYGLSLRYKNHDSKKQVSDDDIADAIAVNTAFHVRMQQRADA